MGGGGGIISVPSLVFHESGVRAETTFLVMIITLALRENGSRALNQKKGAGRWDCRGIGFRGLGV